MKKSKEEIEFDEAVARYEERFGEPYTIYYYFEFGSLAEAIKDINRRIRTGKRKESTPYPNPNIIY